jgi:hypothetical protein
VAGEQGQKGGLQSEAADHGCQGDEEAGEAEGTHEGYRDSYQGSQADGHRRPGNHDCASSGPQRRADRLSYGRRQGKLFSEPAGEKE